jgi:hypothetical protein
MRAGKLIALEKENVANALIDQAKKLRRAFRPKSNIRLKWQAPVWIHKGALQKPEEKHRPTHHAVCTIAWWMVRTKLMGVGV